LQIADTGDAGGGMSEQIEQLEKMVELMRPKFQEGDWVRQVHEFASVRFKVLGYAGNARLLERYAQPDHWYLIQATGSGITYLVPERKLKEAASPRQYKVRIHYGDGVEED
jgi:hypothetical protein